MPHQRAEGGWLAVSKKRSVKQQRRQTRRRTGQLRVVPSTGGPRRLPEGLEDPEDVDLMASINRALRTERPLDLLGLVSSLIAGVDARNRNPFAPEDADESPSYESLLESFLGTDVRQTTAALSVMAALSAEELQAARIKRELAGRRQPLPGWLGQLSDVEVYRAVEMVHVLGDGDDVMLGSRLPTGHELTALVYIDHNLGTVVKDAFMVDEPVADLVALMKRKVKDPDTAWRDLDLADARVRVEEAIEHGAITYPPYETDTWPACRPLVEWLVRILPGDGHGYQRPEWSEADRQGLIDDFFASAHGSPHDDARHRDLLDSIVWLGADYGPGDPLRWSSVTVEILLLDRIPRKIVAEVDHLTPVPDLLRAFIRYCHERCGIRPALTAETLGAVDRYAPEYQQLIRSPRHQGPMALLEAMGLLGADEPVSFEERMIRGLRRRVGGEEVLDRLDVEPLPDEDLDWTHVPDDIRDRVDEVRELCDRCCEQLFDAQYRTACRRLLVHAAVGDPAVFRRRGAAPTAAAAICWIIGKANDAFGSWSGGLQVQELTAHFGLRGSVSQRAKVILRAAGLRSDQYGEMVLGSPELLVSSCREQILKSLERWQARA